MGLVLKEWSHYQLDFEEEPYDAAILEEQVGVLLLDIIDIRDGRDQCSRVGTRNTHVIFYYPFIVYDLTSMRSSKYLVYLSDQSEVLGWKV